MIIRAHVHLFPDPIIGVDVDEREDQIRAPAHDEYDPHGDEHAYYGDTRADVFALFLLVTALIKIKR